MTFTTFLTCAAAMASAPPPAPVAGADLDPVALIREVRAAERWIEEVDSFSIRLEGGWIKSPDAIEQARESLARRYPSIDEFDPEQWWELRPEIGEVLEIAFDDRRLRRFSHWFGASYSMRIWDGRYAFSQYGRGPDELQHCAVADEPTRLVGRDLFMDLSWLRASYHSFWWNPLDAEGWTRSFWGPEADFRIVERTQFRDVDCYVLEGLEGFRRLYVGVDDNRLRGWVQRVLLPDSGAADVIADIAGRRGQHFASTREYYAWRHEQPRAEQDAMDREYYAALIDKSRPQFEHFLLDYREVAPGRWMPMTMGYAIFLETPREDGTYGIDSERRLRVVDVRINEPLADDLFVVEIPKGIEIVDRRDDLTGPFRIGKGLPPEPWRSHLPPDELAPIEDQSRLALTYPYDPKMTQEEFEARVATARQSHEQMTEANRRQEALVGQSAFPFPESTWLNSEPLTWEDLRGKVVILDFWAVWCGPCRGDLPVAAKLHRERGDDDPVVIGVHTPGSELEEIRALIKEYDMRYPVIIDVPRGPDAPKSFGRLSGQFEVFGIPHAVVVDRDGTIAGHGRLEHMIGLAQNLPRARKSGD